MCLEDAERLRSPKPIKRKIKDIVSCCRSVDEKVKAGSHWEMASKMYEGGSARRGVRQRADCSWSRAVKEDSNNNRRRTPFAVLPSPPSRILSPPIKEIKVMSSIRNNFIGS
jgi:hypothetical protein